VAALEDRIDADLALGAHAGLVGELEGLVLEHPLRERMHGQLMLALYRSGRQAEALAAYQRARDQLSDELGLEPGPDLSAMQAAILQHAPSLAPFAIAASTRPLSSSPPPDGIEEPRALGPRQPMVPPVNEPREARSSGRRETRKIVTAMFCDVAGSTSLGEELDPEVLRGVVSRYFAEMRRTIERHGGTVDKFIGDAVMAVFGIPRVSEDDALRAVRAAAEIRERMPAIAQEVGVTLRWRTGVNTGLVLMGEGDNLAIGDALNVAARLEQAAEPGEILIGAETLSMTRDAVEVERLQPLEVKGKSAPLPAFRLIGVDPAAPGVARRLDARLVGRERELRLLREAWDRTVAESGCHLFTLLGAAGVGKSRLVAELISGVGDRGVVLRGRCLPYGEGITFWPLLEALAPVGEPRAEVLEMLKAGGVETPEELFWEVRRLLESLASERPVILDVDDLQWGESMLLDLLEHIVDLSRGTPILVVCSARPELLDERGSWAGGKLNATTILLEPLGPDECNALLARFEDRLDPETRGRVIAVSEGNPLFLEELAAFAAESGTVATPPTVRALLAARLERLPVEERVILELGAVEGEVFHRSALCALTSERPEREVDSRLAALVRKELVRPYPATIQGGDAFRFRHLLIREATYEGLPKATRGELHERFGRWLEQSASELVEHDEIAGWHLEQAVRYRQTLRRDVAPSLSRDAASHLHAAALRASKRSDPAGTTHLLERAFVLAPEGSALRARIAADLAAELIASGALSRADELLSVAESDPGTSALAALTRFEWLLRTAPQDAPTRTIEHALPALLEQLTKAGDDRGIAKAHMAAVDMRVLSARFTPAGEHARLAAEHARKAGDEGLRSRALTAYISAITYGRQHARTIALELDAIEREEPGPQLKARVERGRGDVALLGSRFSEARRLTEHALEIIRTLGMPEREAACEEQRARIEMSAGDPEAAVAMLLRADAKLAEHGERGYRATTQAHLAQAYELLGDRNRARNAIEQSEQLGTAEDVLTLAMTHGVRSRLALADGSPDTAERWARSAVNHAFATDSLAVQAYAKLNLARVLTTVGRRRDAISEARAGRELLTAKGDLPGADHARALLDELGTDTPNGVEPNE
jgi:class 3 adenylate cyclase/tetratricopeptide (TPR) repeat protein